MTSESVQPSAGPSRRTVVAAVGAAGIAVALTACGSDDSDASSGTALAKTSDIPEGGGKIFNDAGVVVTQPVAGQFKAFSFKCTHAGCPVTKVDKGSIICPCHGSKFSIEDGSVQHDPATKPLSEVKVSVSGDEITLA
ncbi:Rieske 2Fe-2S domain-containing protein [Streptomyces sp. HUCO-GS316]|uniref:Rieske (2Fe-2S) protein n=1 Tax=Streptomyces sp. HUCO-GS316 TaxID=2692198 RepID=UPI00136D7AEE|nr:Rieske (2Fe-2S) protein [Streptomyces sp. HUCO-GS316]MXM64101.1 Rieske 2Fe-2S domain-containing protein [Streptomyces sp. HUCO-GS316]